MADHVNQKSRSDTVDTSSGQLGRRTDDSGHGGRGYTSGNRENSAGQKSRSDTVGTSSVETEMERPACHAAPVAGRAVTSLGCDRWSAASG